MKRTKSTIKCVSFKEARQLANNEVSDHAYVYDKFKHFKDNEVTPRSILEKDEKWAKFERKLKGLKEQLTERYFTLVKVDTFDTQEQIDFLISKGKFYYAPALPEEVICIYKTIDGLTH